MHPLSPDLTKISTEDLEKNRAKVNNTLFNAHRTGNSNLVNQLQMLLIDYEEELKIRQDKILEKTNSKGESFVDKINIG